ncbi:tyrosine-type recombinase/integrase [Nereida ignava]|uniref:tyrosine-type recombinase/integrase n=1 Tax=Nereida ignava TaxID=282199 RepID=UPI003F6D15ED
MLHNIPYLTITPKTKTYGYRRRVPKKIQYLFDGKKEIVKSLKTKSLSLAQAEVDKLNAWFEERVATGGYTKSSRSDFPLDLVRKIHSDMKEMGKHPSQLPSIDVHSDPRDMANFFGDVDKAMSLKLAVDTGEITSAEYSAELKPLENGIAWKLRAAQAERGFLLSWLRKKYRHREKTIAENLDPNIDCDAEDYVLPQRKWDETDPEVIRYRIMCGESLLPHPTWQNATDSYIHQYKRSRIKRNPEQLLKHTKAAKSLCLRFGTYLSDGMNTSLSEIDIKDVEAFVDSSNVTDATIVKNLTILRAAWNSWNTHNPKQKTESDLFEVAINDSRKAAKQSAGIRRSLTPNEYAYFSKSISQEKNQEVRLIGKIMAYCGAPTIEAAKLRREDVKLDSSTPYVIFRSTADKVTGKDRLDRAVPLIEPILSELRLYIQSHYTGGKDGSPASDCLFPKLGYGSHSSAARSKALRKHIVSEGRYGQSFISPYSLRHTFKDRASKAGVSTDIAEYLLGHKSNQSSRVHRQYGTKMPASETVELMHRIAAVTHWAMNEEYDQ